MGDASNKTIKIPGRLESAAKDGIVVGTEAIIDETVEIDGKTGYTQAELNQKFAIGGFGPIDPSRIEDGSIKHSKLSSSAVHRDNILDGEITESKISDEAITHSKISIGAVAESNIAADAVTESKIASNAVTESKIASNAVTESKIASNAVTESKIASNAVTESKIESKLVARWNDTYTRDDTYSREQTYSKEQLNNLITTPEQEYVTVSATAETTDVLDVLPSEGEPDTVYRVACWDGTEYNTAYYSEYAWDGTQFVFLDVKDVGIDDYPEEHSQNFVKSGGVYEKAILQEESLSVNTRYYITDKNSTVLGIIKDDGSIEWLQKNEKEQEAEALLKDLSSEIDVDGYNDYYFITDKKSTVIGYIDNEGGVFFYNLKSKGTESEDKITRIIASVNSGGYSERTLNILNQLPKNSYTIAGYKYNTTPFISFHDDDSCDYQLPESRHMGATPETRVPSDQQNYGGFMSLLYPITASINAKHKADIKGKMVYGIAAEGQRIGLTPLYSDVDDFNGSLNTVGKAIRQLSTRCGWDVLCHGMTCRYSDYSYWVSSMEDPLVAQIESSALTNYDQNNWHLSYIHCEDTNLDYEYRSNHEWHLVSKQYIRPYLAKTLSPNATLYFNPRYAQEYQTNEWKKRAKIAGLPFTDALVLWGNSHCRKFIIDDYKYFTNVFGSTDSSSCNEQPLSQSLIRRAHYYSGSTNLWNDSLYRTLRAEVDKCISTGAWLVLSSHSYEVYSRNYYINGVDYGEKRDDSYPSEWIIPLKQEEIEDMIGDNVNNYWVNPPERLGINGWEEWHPCPGTQLDMFYQVVEYAIEQGCELGSSEEGIRRFGNIFNIGLKATSSSTENRLDASEKEQSTYNYIIEHSDGSIEYNVQ